MGVPYNSARGDWEGSIVRRRHLTDGDGVDATLALLEGLLHEPRWERRSLCLLDEGVGTVGGIGIQTILGLATFLLELQYLLLWSDCIQERLIVDDRSGCLHNAFTVCKFCCTRRRALLHPPRHGWYRCNPFGQSHMEIFRTVICCVNIDYVGWNYTAFQHL